MIQNLHAKNNEEKYLIFYSDIASLSSKSGSYVMVLGENGIRSIKNIKRLLI